MKLGPFLRESSLFIEKIVFFPKELLIVLMKVAFRELHLLPKEVNPLFP